MNKDINNKSRIAIIGAGPAGIHMAYLLHKRGYENIVIFEKSHRVGGKAYTINVEGIAYDLGACYLTPCYSLLIDLIKELNLAPPLPIPNAYKKIATTFKMEQISNINDWVFGKNKLMRMFAKTNVLYQLKKYQKIHRQLIGSYKLDFLPEHKLTQSFILNQTFFEFLIGHDLKALLPLFTLVQTIPGYGYLEHIPAYYGLSWITPEFIQGIIHAGLGAKDIVSTFILPNGFQQIFEKTKEKYNLNVLFNVTIHKISRNKTNNPIEISYKINHEDKNQIAYFDLLINAIPVQDILTLLDQPTQLEINIFKKQVHSSACTTLVSATNVTASNHIIYAPNMISPGKQGSVYAVLNKRNCVSIGKEMAPLNKEYFVVYQYIDYHQFTITELECILLRELKRVGIKNIEIIEQYTTPYFYRFENPEIKKGYPWQIITMQGLNNTVYIGSSVCFESINSVMNYNQLVIEKIML